MTPSGRRFSQRLHEKKLKQSSGALHVPTAPPPPPLPPVCVKREEPGSPKHALKVKGLSGVLLYFNASCKQWSGGGAK